MLSLPVLVAFDERGCSQMGEQWHGWHTGQSFAPLVSQLHLLVGAWCDGSVPVYTHIQKRNCVPSWQSVVMQGDCLLLCIPYAIAVFSVPIITNASGSNHFGVP